MYVKDIKIRKILASNAQFTLELEIKTDKGKVRASVPIGTSKGKFEAFSLPVNKAIETFSFIKRHFLRLSFDSIEDVDELLKILDKTGNFRKIGGNLALAISSAFLKAFALQEEKKVFEYIAEMAKTKPSIPKPICNVIGGGKHGGKTEIQEFHLLAIHQTSFLESVEAISKAYLEIAKELERKDSSFLHSRNLESAWVTNLNYQEILEILSKFCDTSIKIGLDFAASHFWDGNFYQYKSLNTKLNPQEQLSFVHNLVKTFPIYFIEDPFHENDFVSFASLTSLLPNKLVCGDDLYTTSLERLKQGLDIKATNCVLIKPNQVGTISDTIEFFKLAKKNNLKTVFSHRSAETEDTLICHLAIGLGADFVKFGIGGERALKLNEIIRTEEELSESP